MPDEPIETPEARDAFGALPDGPAASQLPAEPPAAAEPADAVEPAPVEQAPASPDPDVEPEYEPQAAAEAVLAAFDGMDEDEFAESFEEYVDEVGPVEAAQALAALAALEQQQQNRQRVEQYEEGVGQVLQPVLQREYDAQAADTIAAMESEFGSFFDRDALAEHVQANADFYASLEPSAQRQAVRNAAASLAFQAQSAYLRGEDVKQSMREYVQPRDAFGNRDFGPPEPAPLRMPQAPAQPVEQPTGQPRDPATGQFQPYTTAFVEGGSTPQPQGRVESTDPEEIIKAEIRGSDKRDAFGVVPGW